MFNYTAFNFSENVTNLLMIMKNGIKSSSEAEVDKVRANCAYADPVTDKALILSDECEAKMDSVDATLIRRGHEKLHKTG
jgi:hypothetical protein